MGCVHLHLHCFTRKSNTSIRIRCRRNTIFVVAKVMRSSQTREVGGLARQVSPGIVTSNINVSLKFAKCEMFREKNV